MDNFFKTLWSLLSYKEPKNEELGFELLESENEGVEQADTQESAQEGAQDGAQDGAKDNVQDGSPKGASQGVSIMKIRRSRFSVPSDEIAKDRKNENGSESSTNCNESKSNSAQSKSNSETKSNSQKRNDTDTISSLLCANLETIRQKFLMPKNHDIIIREFNIGKKLSAFMVYVDGMVDKKILNISVLPQLMSKDVFEGIGYISILDNLIKNVLTVNEVRKEKKYGEMVLQVLNGMSALFVEGCEECLLIEAKGFEKRTVDSPKTESVVRGSQEGFTENVRTNLTLIRKIVKNEKLITEMIPIGATNNPSCAIIYLEGAANPKVIQEVKRRLKSIDTDLVLDSGMLEQFIEDNPFMLFPQVLNTERPDRAASFIMEGQVVIIADGSPFALTVPVTFFRLFHTSEDMFLRWPYGSFIRLIRMIGLFCATWLPGFYVALILFHPEMLPTELLTSIARSKEAVPFPTLVEVLIMEVSFELIREGGIRIPSVLGQTLGIVGALILGQAAVSAGLVSPILVIVVSVTALGSFTIPDYSMGIAIRIERFFFIIAGALLGFYGIALMVVLFALLACSMKSFGVPYFAPIAPRTKVNPDVILRYPVWMQKNRPDGINSPNRKRQGNNKRVWLMDETDSKEEEERA